MKQEPSAGWRSTAGMFVAGLVALALGTGEARSDAWGLAYGRGMSDALIQSKNISNAEMAAVTYDMDVNLPPAWRTLADEAELQWMAARALGNHLGKRQNLFVGQVTYVFLGDIDGVGTWRWKAGIGGAWMSSSRFKSVNLGGRLNFSLQAGVVYRSERQGEWTLTYQHYSNGYTRSENPGLDFWLLGWRHGL